MITMFRISALRPFVPVLVGICLGIALNMMVAPFFDEICDQTKAANQQKVFEQIRDTNTLGKKKNLRMKKEPASEDQDLEDKTPTPSLPILHEVPKFQDTSKKFVRPRFASTELGIREKLLVAVLTSPNTINSYGLAVNKTLTHYVTKTIFFMTTKSGIPPPGMTVVGFSEQHHAYLPIHILRYIRDHYANSFDYYMFITDRTYVRAEKVFELVSHISVSQDIHLGTPEVDDNGHQICSIEGGIIISQSVMAKTLSQLSECASNSHPSNPSITLGRCIYEGSEQMCADHGGDKVYKHYRVVDFDFEDDITILRNDPKFNASLSVFPMPDDISQYKIHRYFCQLELNLTKQEIEKAKENIVYLSQFGPGGRDSLTWPLGASEAVKPKTRFDVIRWAYFTDKDIYFNDDFTNVRKLRGADKEDIDEILKVAFDKVNKENNKAYKHYQLQNGYRRFEPARGLEYTVDLLVQKADKKNEMKRVHLLRPLNKVEIIPMPYVTENTRVNLVVPVFAEDRDDFPAFMETFSRAVFDNNDNTVLFLLLLYQSPISKGKHDMFSSVKTTISYYISQQPSGENKITWKTMEINSSSVSEFDLSDRIVKEFHSDTLLTIGTVGMEVDLDYLNRVRMNTIRGWQVFFPIPFWQYKQNLAYDHEPYPSMVELNQKYGHFDVSSYEHCSFYAADYITLRKTMTPTEIKNGQLFDMFLKNKKLHIFRAADPALRHRWKYIACHSQYSEDRYAKCLQRRSSGLASRAQLARLVFEHQERLGMKTSHSVSLNTKPMQVPSIASFPKGNI